MKRIVVEGYTTAERKLMVESLRVVRALLRDVELALTAQENATLPLATRRGPVVVPQRATLTTSHDSFATVTPIGRMPQQKWSEILPAIMRGELDQYTCVQKLGSAYANASLLRRKYPDVEALVSKRADGTALLTLRLIRETESA